MFLSRPTLQKQASIMTMRAFMCRIRPNNLRGHKVLSKDDQPYLSMLRRPH